MMILLFLFLRDLICSTTVPTVQKIVKNHNFKKLKYICSIMRKSHFTVGLIILLSSVTLLIGVQVYWIQSIMKIGKANLARDIYMAMNEVIKTLEQIEIANDIHEYEGEMHFDVNTNKFIDRCTHEDDEDGKLNFFVQKSMLTEDFFEQLFLKNKRRLIEDRIDPTVLDSIMNTSLRRKGLTPSNFEYAVYHPLRDTMFYEHRIENIVDFKDGAVSYKLFPSDNKKDPAYLLVYMPNFSRSVFIDFLPMIIVNIILLLITIVLVAVLYNMLYQQRKLSEIENDFINNMTHEFKTPISTIALAGEALSDPVIKKHPNLSDQYIKIIREEDKRLGAMAEKILTTATIDNGKLKLKKEYFDVNEVVMDVVNKVKMQIEIKDGIITTKLTPSNATIYADKLHITNLITNLIDNANKYSPKKPVIEVITKIQGGNSFMIAVKDNGIGIAKADQKKIFDKLYRVPTGNIHDFKGFGLGLSYVKAIVTAHKGTVNVESEPGKGSTFFVYLPIKNTNK